MKKILLLSLLVILSACSFNSSKIELSKKFYDSSDFITLTSDEVNNNKSETYLIFTYNNYCNLEIPCDQIFEEFMINKNISMYKIPFEEFKNTYLYDKVKFAPSVIIVDNGEVIDYLKADSDEDLNKYQDVNEFTLWVEKYIKL